MINPYFTASIPATEDAFQRRVSYLRISVTDRCNLRCSYCMPSTGMDFWKPEVLLTNNELFRLIDIFTGLGVRKVRLTGGEPLLRPDLDVLVRFLKSQAAIEDISVSTNGIYLEKSAARLRAAGLARINISLDTFRAERFKTISKTGDLADVRRGIEAALLAGFSPVKLNAVIMRGINDDEIADFVDFAIRHPVQVRFIELMPTHNNRLGDTPVSVDAFMASEEILDKVKTLATLGPEEPRGGVARVFPLAGGLGKVGFISPVSNHFCGSCNRLRLTARGELKTCLHGSDLVDLRTPMREGASDAELVTMIRQAVLGKPPEHFIRVDHFVSSSLQMSQVGG
jgi:cyclic pyranopterin phosphate synthase